MIWIKIKKLRQAAPRYYWQLLQSRARAHLQRNQELWVILTEYLQQSNSTGCAYTDYLTLYQYVRRYKPKEVLECGTGISTVILAQALKENKQETGVNGRLVSMEELSEFHSQAVKLLPLSLKPYVEIKLSPTVEDSYAFIRGMRYRDVPERDYDFVFIDGPNTKTKSDQTISCDFDFIYQLLRAKDDKSLTAIIDRRHTTGLAFQALLGRDKVRYDYVRELGFVGPVRASDLSQPAISYHRSAPHPFRRHWF